jgi:hypothetical protein
MCFSSDIDNLLRYWVRTSPDPYVKPGSGFYFPNRVSAGFHLRFSGSLSKHEPENT